MSKSTLTAAAELVRLETIEGANSANRIGQLFKNIISEMIANSENQSINIQLTYLQSPIVPKASGIDHAQSRSGVEDQISLRITQNIGTSTTQVMSQKAVTDELALKEFASYKRTDLTSYSHVYYPTVRAVYDALTFKFDKNSIVDYAGSSSTMVISQSGVTVLLSFKLDKSSVKNSTGSSTTDVMSQKAVTDELALKELASNKKTNLSSFSDQFYPTVKAVANALANKIDRTSLVDETGDSSEFIMSQRAVSDELALREYSSYKRADLNVISDVHYPSVKAVTDALALKLNKSAVKTVTGSSDADVMSQKAVTDELALKELASNKKTDLTSNSDSFFPTVKAMVTALLAKFDKSSVKTVTGSSETDVMSQKAVTDELTLKELASNKKTDLTSNSDSFFPTVKAMVTALLLKLDKSAAENAERALADTVAHLLGRIETLEQELAESKYAAMQVDELSVVNNIKLKGADLILFGTAAPAVTPDFVGQFFVNTTGGVTYQAKGIANSGDWKQTSN